MAFDPMAVRGEFPILHQEVNGKPLVYLDNGATTQKPRAVIDAISGYYERDNANVHRGVHTLAHRADTAYESARSTVQKFIGARFVDEVVWTKGTTDAVNLVAHSFLASRLGAGDRIVVTEMEHHANIVPWQLLAARVGAEVVAAPVTDAGEMDLQALDALLDERVKLLGIMHVSNVLGTVNPVAEVVRMAQAKGVPVLVDGAQAVAHTAVDVASLGCDFYTFSGHKLFGPTGVGVLYGKRELLKDMPPFEGGGDMISSVSFGGSTFKDPPGRFEAGTPHIAGVIGLAAAIDWFRRFDVAEVAAHEEAMRARATALLEGVDGLRVIGTAAHKAAVVSFVHEQVHPHDLASILDAYGVAVRAGHHCAEPLMHRYGVPATTRASFALYNTLDECDALAHAVREAVAVFA